MVSFPPILLPLTQLCKRLPPSLPAFGGIAFHAGAGDANLVADGRYDFQFAALYHLAHGSIAYD
jgi:hypothetical protein